jgi:multidrug resistance efflux pump
MYLGNLRIIGIVENGTIVNEGDSVIQLDHSDVNRLILDRETNLETQMANLEKLRVTQSNQIGDMESRIKSETASFNLKKIALESSRFDTERQRTISQLEFKQAEILFAKEKRKLELAKIINVNDIKIQMTRIRQMEDDLKQFKQILPQLTVRSTAAGVFQRGRNPASAIGQPFMVGDYAYTGYSIGIVPEFKWMKVRTFINETDFLKLQIGQKVNVRLDALPEVKFNGEVAYISKLCLPREQNSKQKGFEVEVKMLEPDERLKPGMTVSCEFLSIN